MHGPLHSESTTEARVNLPLMVRSVAAAASAAAAALADAAAAILFTFYGEAPASLLAREVP